jgi:hypothetical protein
MTMKELLLYRKISGWFIYLLITVSSCNNVSLALLETADVTYITSSGAISGGNITSDGGNAVKARGVCWGTTTNPTTGGNKTNDGSGAGSFSSSISGLLPETIYYVRAYATNSSGTSYGNEKVFSTLKENGTGSNQIIADHTSVIDFNKIPAQYIAEVKKMMVCFLGESHSAAYKDGMEMLEASNQLYACNIGTNEGYTDKYVRVVAGQSTGEDLWFTWFAYPTSSRPPAGNTIKNIITEYSNHGHPLSAIGFAWCIDHVDGTASPVQDEVYQVSWYGLSEGGPDGNKCWGLDASDFSITGNRVCMDTYLNATEDYIDYCKKNKYSTKIIFTTCPPHGLYYDARGYQGHLKQEYIRNFVKADPSRILFDYADILCYDDDGTTATTTWEGHTFPSITAKNLGDESIGHIGPAGAVRLAKAQWWLLARIAGWDGK